MICLRIPTHTRMDRIRNLRITPPRAFLSCTLALHGKPTVLRCVTVGRWRHVGPEAGIDTMIETAVEASSHDFMSIVSPAIAGMDAQIQPEKRLMLAVLEGAVSDFQKYATAASGR